MEGLRGWAYAYMKHPRRSYRLSGLHKPWLAGYRLSLHTLGLNMWLHLNSSSPTISE